MATTLTSPSQAKPPQGTADTDPKPKGRNPMAAHPALWLFPIPALVLYIAFFVIPTIQGVVYSVTDWDGFSPTAQFVGLDNFTTILTSDDLFRNALSNNIKFMLVVVIFQTIFSLALGVYLTKNTKSSVALRSLYFFPTILSSVSVAFIWKFVYDPNFGLINTVLGAVGLDRFQSAFLGNDNQAIYWVAITQVWFHVGQMMIIYVAGLQQIPQELYESAEIDGAEPLAAVPLRHAAHGRPRHGHRHGLHDGPVVQGLRPHPRPRRKPTQGVPRHPVDPHLRRLRELPVRLRRSRVPHLHGPHRRHHLAAAASRQGQQPGRLRRTP